MFQLSFKLLLAYTVVLSTVNVTGFPAVASFPNCSSKGPRARIYRSSFGRENDRFHENMPKPLVFNLIRTQKRRSRLILDEIKLGGGFQILGLRRGGDQLVFIPKERPY